MNRQQFSPRTIPEKNVLRLSKIGSKPYDANIGGKGNASLTAPQGESWSQSTVHRDPMFALQVAEQYLAEEKIGYTYQENWIKFNFRLAGHGTTVLNGFGETDHNGPEVFITAGPPEMLKVDLRPKGFYRWVALCVPQEFFSSYLQWDTDALPEVLRHLIAPEKLSATAHRLSLTPDIEATLQSIYNVPASIRESALYSQAKVVELSCLLLSQFDDKEQAANKFSLTPSRLACLDHAGELLSQNYAEHWTLSYLAKSVGLSKSALTQGFRQRFGLSVFEFLHRRRMQKASELLSHAGRNVTEISQAVGYEYHCNFSTAFRQYFGVSPKDF